MKEEFTSQMRKMLHIGNYELQNKKIESNCR